MAARDEHFTPGFTTSSQAELITNALLTQGRMQQEMDTGDPSTAPRSLLPVKLTGRSSVTGLYSWTEQTFDSTGARTDRPGGRSGTTTVSPVRLLGDAVLTTFPAEAWVVRCITTASGGIMYEGIAVGLDAFEEIELDTIRKACVTKASGVVTNITFEHQKVRILGVVLTDEAYCNTGEDDCCPSIVTECCPSVPRLLTLSLTATGDYAPFDGLKVCFEYSEAATANSLTLASTWTPIAANESFAGSITTTDGYLSQVYFTRGSGVTEGPQLLRVGMLVCGGASASDWLGNLNGDNTLLDWFLGNTDPWTTYRCQVFDQGTSGIKAIGSLQDVDCNAFSIINDGDDISTSCSTGADPTGTISFVIAATAVGDCDGMTSTSCACTECPGVDQWYLTGETAALACVDTTGWPGWEAIDCFYAQAGFTGWSLMHSTATGYWQLINLSTMESYNMIDTDFVCAGPNEFDIGFTVTLTP